MKPTRLLVVEDEFIVASDLEARLTDLGYEIAGRADTGALAIERAAATKPDLVLMDIRLKGGMDGIAAAGQIRSNQKLPVVFLTAFADDTTLQRAKAVEPYGYIIKPFEDRELRTIIEIALYKHKAEREIQRLNRLYAALSQINETIIRATTREELFTKVSRIACEIAGFKLAWVGWLDRATQEVVPVGRSGQAAGYLDQVKIYADDRPEGRGPAGDCVRTGEPCISNDFLCDPRSAPWREQLQGFGLHAAAGLPLRFGGEISGVLMVYGDEPDVFRDKEVALLQEAAADISFALDHLAQVEQTRKLAQAVEQSPSLIIITDVKGRIEYVNPKFCQVTGYSQKEVLGKNPRILKSNEMPKEIYRELWQTISAGQEWRGELYNRKRDGELFWESASISPITNASGKTTHYLAVKEDITQRKETEQALRESESKWRSYMENAPMGILVAEASGQHVEANRAAEEMLGYSHEELLKTHVKDIPANPADKAVAKHFAEILKDGYSEGEFQLRRKNGEQLWASMRALKLDGERLLAVFQDTTRHRQMEMELRQAQKMEAVAHLAGGVAHDFNNILAAMLMQLSLLHLKPNLDEETRRALIELDTAAWRGADIIRQLLLFSRRSVMTIKPLNLQKVLTELIKMLKRLIGENIQLLFETEPTPLWVEGDSSMMEQVLMNLVVNARDAMPNGGKITIAVRNATIDDASAAQNPQRRAGEFICLSVADTGCGMDAATKKRIFEPFFTTKEAGKGTGLGLATVHGIVTQHHGWLEVESEPAAGTTFRAYLPVCPPSTESAKVSPGQPVPTGNERILLVEDDADVRRAVRQTLCALGYQVLEASDGEEALKILQPQASSVDLLMTDMVMPNGITGLDLVEKARALRPGLRAIVASGYSEEIVKMGSLAKSDIIFLAKPFSIDVVANTVRQSLDRKA